MVEIYQAGAAPLRSACGGTRRVTAPMSDGSMTIEFLTVAEASRRLDVSQQTVRRMADRGELPCIRTPHERLIFAGPVDARVKAAQAKAATS